jgi:Ser/Thr protein kinase RdoA (MazF antagonist)
MTGNTEGVDVNLLEKICSHYDISGDQLNFLTAVDNNFVYEFSKQDKSYILRGGTRHPVDQVQAELDWIIFLHSNGVLVSLPIKSRNGKYLEQVHHNDVPVNATIFERAPGIAVDYRNPEVWNEILWKEMGKTLGKMHAAAVKYNSENPHPKRITAFESVQNTMEAVLDPKKDKKVIERFQKLKNKLTNLPKENESFGLIQYDFHADNFNIDDGKIIVYDFDDSYYFFFMYDLAACIHEAIWDVPEEKKLEFANRFIPSLWDGYSEEFKLDRKWLEYLPDFLKWREFDIYSTIVESLKENTLPEKYIPEYKHFEVEFRNRVESDDQIVPMPEQISGWFKEN